MVTGWARVDGGSRRSLGLGGLLRERSLRGEERGGAAAAPPARSARRAMSALRSRRRGAGRSDRHGHERAGARGSDRTRRGAIAKHAADTAKGGTQRTAARKRGGHHVRVSEHGASAHTGRAARPVAREGLCGGIARSRRLYRNPRFSNGLSNHKSSCFWARRADDCVLVPVLRRPHRAESRGAVFHRDARSFQRALEGRHSSAMSDFFSPLEEDQVTRTQQDEDEERIAEAVRAKAGPGPKVFGLVRVPLPLLAIAPPRPARPSPTPALTLARPSSLSVEPGVTRRHRRGRSDRSRPRRRRRRARVRSPRRPHALASPDRRPHRLRDHRAGVSANPSHEDNTGVVYAFENHPDVLLVAARYDVPPERARAWAKSLADAVQPSECTVVVAAVDERDVDRGSDGYRGAYALDTTTMRRRGCRIECRVGCRGAANPARDARGGYRGCDDGEKRGDWSSGETRRRTGAVGESRGDGARTRVRRRDRSTRGGACRSNGDGGVGVGFRRR